MPASNPPPYIPMGTHNRKKYDSRAPMSDSGILVSMGVYDGVTGVNKFGSNAAVGTAFEDVWTLGGKHVEFSGAALVEVASTSANDTAAGTGARTITIYGLDTAGLEVSESVTLNGTTPVAATLTYLHVHRIRVDTAGTGLTNAGTITVANVATAWVAGVASTATDVEVQVPVGYGQSQCCRYTIPAGKTGYITNIYIIAAASKTVTFQLIQAIDSGVERVTFEGTLINSEFLHRFGPAVSVPENTTILMRAKVDVGTAEVSAGIDLVLIDNATYNL